MRRELRVNSGCVAHLALRVTACPLLLSAPTHHAVCRAYTHDGRLYGLVQTVPLCRRCMKTSASRTTYLVPAPRRQNSNSCRPWGMGRPCLATLCCWSGYLAMPAKQGMARHGRKELHRPTPAQELDMASSCLAMP